MSQSAKCAPSSRTLANFYAEIGYRLLYFLPPMRHIRGNDDDVALSDLTNHASVHRGTSDLVGRRVLSTHHCAPGGKRRRALQHIKDISVFGMDFDFARFVPMERLHAIVPLGISVI